MTSDAGAADLIAQCAAVLHGAESSRRPIEPLTNRFPELTVPEAYRIQQANVERRLKRGEHVVGHKIGLTARAMQEMFGVNEPDYGHLLDTMLHDERVPLDLGTLIDPQIEIEPAFVLGSKLQGPNVGVADVLAATEYVCVCFEVIDSRIIDWRVRLQDTVADNGSSARVVLGAVQGETRTPSSSTTWRPSSSWTGSCARPATPARSWAIRPTALRGSRTASRNSVSRWTPVTSSCREPVRAASASAATAAWRVASRDWVR